MNLIKSLIFINKFRDNAKLSKSEILFIENYRKMSKEKKHLLNSYVRYKLAQSENITNN